jgi:(p)ppGpp synthase/HD superfamily hydrolase
MDIYAPLAERIGMYEFMQEMQTLAFRELEPDAYKSISKRLEQLHKGGGDMIDRIGRGIKAHLEAHGIEAKVQGREKHPYSIWRKMAERHVSFEQLSDVMAFRAIERWVLSTSAGPWCPDVSRISSPPRSATATDRSTPR